MNTATRKQLLTLNRCFYETVAEPFNATRQVWTPGKRALLGYVPAGAPGQPIRIADIGCGNGRFACMVDTLGKEVAYMGVDANGDLLALAAANTADLGQTRVQFVQADIAAEGWTKTLGKHAYDMTVCLATLQHMPGYDLRCQIVGDLARVTGADGLMVVSAWQFLTSERFAAKQIPWESVGLTEGDVEPGDALLPWKQGVYAVRYVHQINEAEMRQLAEDAGLAVTEVYRADGKEGNLNLYGVMKPRR